MPREVFFQFRCDRLSDEVYAPLKIPRSPLFQSFSKGKENMHKLAKKGSLMNQQQSSSGLSRGYRADLNFYRMRKTQN